MMARTLLDAGDITGAFDAFRTFLLNDLASSVSVSKTEPVSAATVPADVNAGTILGAKLDVTFYARFYKDFMGLCLD